MIKKNSHKKWADDTLEKRKVKIQKKVPVSIQYVLFSLVAHGN